MSQTAGFFFVEVGLVGFIYTQVYISRRWIGMLSEVLVPKILRESCPTGKTDGGESVKSSTSSFSSLSFPFTRIDGNGEACLRDELGHADECRWAGGIYRGTKTLVLPTGLWCFRCATARLLDPIPLDVRSFFFLTQFAASTGGESVFE
jgi:hypothetical protein